METSLPKRRKVSPQAAVPLPGPNDTTTPRVSPPRPLSAAGRRPSFASPTRASLQRYNPDILRRRSSSPRKPGPEQDAVPPASRPTSADSNQSLSRALAAHLDQQSKAGDSNARDSQPPLPIPATRPGPSQQQKQQTAKPSPRPLPPPGPDDDDEEILNPFGGRVLRRSPRIGVPSPEPELPPTPEHGDPVVSTPPSGIHNTPSKHPRRSRALAERLKSSSPLKQPPLRPPPTKSQPPRPGSERLASQLNEPNAPPPLTTAELRGLQPPDPDAEKKKTRDSLLAEIAALERDLDLASTENERIRQARLAKREPSPPTASTKDDILDLLRRRVLPPEKDTDANPDPSTAWLRSLLNPIAFLPFSKPTATPPTPDPPQAKDDQPPPISHHPIAMTADEALPYLQVFTPLTFTSHISTLPRQPDSQTPLLQRHSITATSTSPRGLFAARLEMTVNTKTMAVTDVAVPRLDPAAVSELGPFVEQIAASTKDGALANNISVLGWAMGEWLRVATQRAKVWCVLERELMGGKAALEGMVARSRTRRRRSQRQRLKRRREGDDAEGDDDDQEEEDGVGGKFETAQLLPFMGRTSMDFEIPVLGSSAAGDEMEGSTLRVQWRIEFDWTGEARSNIGVLVGVPGKWHKCDERGQLSGIPKMFDELIQGGDEPLTAVRTVVSLLAGEQGS
ncbi:hypothetical protein B0T19DRAFT_398066 [Cercophora scortea]|uniref:Uncharacterized protein n=1 Tax=Cercophora scortea TaxID=314031 RepID=A0AAE0IXD7_9PEZI|nr:hypothetical protein B0T19DRAFT_398066 [Cercophora scortea]